MNGWPTAADANDGLVISGGSGNTSRVNTAVPVPLAFVALMLTMNVPSIVGIPVIIPVLVSTVSPGGKSVALKVTGELVAVI